MDVRVDAEGPDAADRLRSLYGWLSDDQLLRGRLGLRERPPEPGTLGPVLEAVLVALGPGGAATALATGVIAWLRNRRGDVRLKVTLEDGRSLELTGKRVAGLDAAALRRQAADLAALLGQGDENPERRHLEPREPPEPREIPECGGHGDPERRDLS
ncbi:effector-associated constant component EACC1 [Streptomyces griseofuscus]|uniref:effector-associated constant component EACC1 n=1 Tax=Streptomyces griseofuscus TaxID=146922 RepID=UPI0036AED5B6